MRMGFFLGFLIGAAVASILSQTRKEDDAPVSVTIEDTDREGPLDKLRRRAQDAMQAAREAAEEKEREMLRRYEETRRD
jgi:hypothetical protein